MNSTANVLAFVSVSRRHCRYAMFGFAAVPQAFLIHVYNDVVIQGQCYK